MHHFYSTTELFALEAMFLFIHHFFKMCLNFWVFHRTLPSRLVVISSLILVFTMEINWIISWNKLFEDICTFCDFITSMRSQTKALSLIILESTKKQKKLTSFDASKSFKLLLKWFVFD